MKRLLHFLLLLALAPTAATKAQNDQWVDWSEDRPLNWSDFRGEIPDGNSNVAARTRTRIMLNYEVNDQKLTFNIKARFSCNRSWGREKNDYILRHEQGHFNIAEIAARRLCKALRQYTVIEQRYDQDITKIYDEVVEEIEQLQRTYDLETHHSTIQEKQEWWDKKIAEMLTELEAWAHY